MQELPEVPDSLGLYLHLPWCLKKCPYCDFNSHVAPGTVPEQAYTDALLQDFGQAIEGLPGRRIDSLFFGGGTPSLFSPESIARIIDEIRATGLLRSDAEVTLEANPGAADSARFRGYRQAGVTRLSIGVQSFDDDLLKRIGRAHDGKAARVAVAAAAESFQQFSVDLMYGLPGQTPTAARDDVNQALASGASHLSCYQLTLEPNTLFFSRPPDLPAEAISEAIEQTVHGTLLAAGFSRYEVSNWCTENQACRHNLNYWRYGDYLGLGAGAHSKLTCDDGVLRVARLRKPNSYIAQVGSFQHIGDRRFIDRQSRSFEFLLNALRLTGGFALERYERTTGCSRREIAPSLRRCGERGLLEVAGGRVQPTALGRRFLNIILRECLPSERQPRTMLAVRPPAA